ncbi:MAG: cupin domain-containing protein [archaeon]
MDCVKVNLEEKLNKFSEYWTPKIVGALNGQHVKVVKLKGSFVWHQHELEDEFFMVLDGELKIHFRENTATIKKGEFIIIPRGTEHLPEAEGEVHVMLFEPASTVNTGRTESDLRVENPEWI